MFFTVQYTYYTERGPSFFIVVKKDLASTTPPAPASTAVWPPLSLSLFFSRTWNMFTMFR